VSEFEQGSFIEQIASELRRPVRFDPRFDDRVMEAIEAPEVIPLRPALPRPWILRPWTTITVSPLGSLAIAAGVAGFIALGVWRGGAPTPGATAVTPGSPTAITVADDGLQVHQFLITVPDASKMVVVGDFNDWDATRTPMTRINDQGMWSVVVRLSEGLHEFQYVKDDSLRINDPTLPQTSSEFGSPNSVLAVAPRSR
jgi:hypothetical protein